MPATLVSSLILALALSNLSAQEKEKPTPSQEVSPRIQELIEAHNQAREREGLPPLAANPMLNEAAWIHARDMADHQELSHEGSDGSTPDERIKKTGYQPQRTGENVASGQKTIQKLMAAWMKSPPHRRNILGDFLEIGAAEVKGEDGRLYWAVEFGKAMPKLDPEMATREVVERLNQIRSGGDHPKLFESLKLSKAAQVLANEQAKGSTPEESSNKSRLEALLRDLGYDYRTLREHRASGYPAPEKLVEGLLDRDGEESPLRTDFREIGVGYAQDGEGTPYWVILLADPRPGH